MDDVKKHLNVCERLALSRQKRKQEKAEAISRLPPKEQRAIKEGADMRAVLTMFTVILVSVAALAFLLP